MPEQPEKTSKPKDTQIGGVQMVDADIALRNHFASIALAEIVKWQVAERKAGQEDVAASWAFRYADRMVDQSKKHSKGRPQNIKGVPGVTEEPMVEVQ